jgi:threonine 3-dehydrogenase
MGIVSRFVFKERAGNGGLGLRSVVLPDPDAADVLIKIHSASICGTDLHIYKWNDWAAGAYQPPFRLGHEFGGTVVAIGPDVRALKPGDRVTAETHIPCGHCHQCRLNRRHTCDNLQLFSRLNAGCFSDHTLVPRAALRVVPPEIPLEHATMMEPLGISVRAVSEAGVSGTNVLVLGCGPIGLFAIVAARAYGAASVFATDLSDYRLELARDIGATATINPQRGPLGISSADVVIETTGSEAAFAEALGCVRKGARVVFASLPERPFSLDITRHVVLREIAISGVYGRRIDETWIEAERLLASHGSVLARTLTHRFPLESFEAAFALAASGKAGKVVLLPN